MPTSITAPIVAAVEQLRLLLVGVPGFGTVAEAPYLFRPFIMLIALGIIAGLVGVLVNLRRMEFDAEASVHAIFPGVVAGAIYGGIDAIVPAASLVAVAVVIALVAVHRHSRGHDEAGTAVVLTSFFALGVVLLLKEGDMSGQLESLMFGRLLQVSDTRMVESLTVCALALIVLAATWRTHIAVAFDEVGARAAGTNTLLIDLIVTGCVAAVVVAASTAVGILLVVGYLVIPGAAARLVTTSIRGMAAVSTAVGIGSGYLGLIALDLPTSRPLSPQAAVALTMVAIFAAIFLAARLTTLIRTHTPTTAR